MLPTTSETNEMTPILILTLGEQYYALRIEDVVEVAAMVELVSISDVTLEILGMANRHGDVLPILDLRLVMDCSQSAIDEWTLFVVAQSRNQFVGLVVDEVQQVEYVPVTQIHKSSASGKYIHGIISYKKRLIQLVALPALIEAYVSDIATDDMLKVDS